MCGRVRRDRESKAKSSELGCGVGAGAQSCRERRRMLVVWDGELGKGRGVAASLS